MFIGIYNCLNTRLAYPTDKLIKLTKGLLSILLSLSWEIPTCIVTYKGGSEKKPCGLQRGVPKTSPVAYQGGFRKKKLCGLPKGALKKEALGPICRKCTHRFPNSQELRECYCGQNGLKRAQNTRNGIY